LTGQVASADARRDGQKLAGYYASFEDAKCARLLVSEMAQPFSTLTIRTVR